MRKITSAFLLFWLGYSSAQSDSESVMWIEASEKIEFSSSTSGLLLFQRRIFLDRPNTHQHLFWISGHHRINRFKIGGGLMYFTYHKYLDNSYQSIPEIRPFQFLHYSVSKKKFACDFRMMAEERYLSEIKESEILFARNLELRYRFRPRVSFTVSPKSKISLSNEVFWTGEALTQNRAVGSISHQIKALTVSAGYMHWLVQVQDGYEVRNTWMVQVQHKLKH